MEWISERGEPQSMERAESADKAARLEALMAQYGTALWRMCTLQLQDAALAEDAVQDTFLKAYRRMDAFRGACSEQTWLMAIAINTCRDYRRTAWMRHTERSVPLDRLPESSAEAPFPDSAVTEAVSSLSPREREAVLLRYYQGMKLREVAQALRISENAAKARLHRANEHLRARLERWYFDED